MGQGYTRAQRRKPGKQRKSEEEGGMGEGEKVRNREERRKKEQGHKAKTRGPSAPRRL